MYTCEKCKKAFGPGERPVLKANKVRKVIYKHYNRGRFQYDSYGKEIISEIAVCNRCVPYVIEERIGNQKIIKINK